MVSSVGWKNISSEVELMEHIISWVSSNIQKTQENIENYWQFPSTTLETRKGYL